MLHRQCLPYVDGLLTFITPAPCPAVSQGNVPASQISAQIATLNKDYANYGFQFVLAGTDTVRRSFSLVLSHLVLTSLLFEPPLTDHQRQLVYFPWT